MRQQLSLSMPLFSLFLYSSASCSPVCPIQGYQSRLQTPALLHFTHLVIAQPLFVRVSLQGLCLRGSWYLQIYCHKKTSLVQFPICLCRAQEIFTKCKPQKTPALRKGSSRSLFLKTLFLLLPVCTTVRVGNGAGKEKHSKKRKFREQMSKCRAAAGTANAFF